MSERSLKTATPFRAFIFTGGAPELADIDARSQLNCLAVASRHRRPNVSESSSPRHHDALGENLVEFGGSEHW
jgi:hypothetical protein